ncbi:LamG domain-containing protein [Candidatus Poribacteria bacterium]|nr:LamG domain-containing protein [Candidatus Poribacteria bacterium]
MRILIWLIIGLFGLMVSFCEAVDKPLVVHLSFDGKEVKDLSPNKNKAENKGAKFVDGQFETALQFEGVGDYVEVPNNDSLNVTEEITVEAWIYVEKQPAGNAWSALVGKNPYQVGYLMWFEDENLMPRGLIWVSGTRYNVNSSLLFTEKKWYHTCYTVKQGQMDIYINGDLKGTTKIPKGDFGTNGNPLRVGGQGGGPGFNGIIDDVAVYSVALTPKEIKDDMDKGVQPLAVQPSGKLATTWGKLKD